MAGNFDRLEDHHTIIPQVSVCYFCVPRRWAEAVHGAKDLGSTLTSKIKVS